jgi:hypothetical protein
MSRDSFGHPVIRWDSVDVREGQNSPWWVTMVPVYYELPDIGIEGAYAHKTGCPLSQWKNGKWGYVTMSNYNFPAKTDSLEKPGNWKIVFRSSGQSCGEAFVVEDFRDELIKIMVNDGVAILYVNEIRS